MWEKLKYDEQYNAEMVAIVLRSEAINRNIRYDFKDFTDDDIKTIFSAYNGSGNNAKLYGEQLLGWQKIFYKYR